MKRTGLALMVMALSLALSGPAWAKGRISLGGAIGAVDILPQSSGDYEPVFGANVQVDGYYNFNEQWAVGLKALYGISPTTILVMWDYYAIDVVGRYTHSLSDHWGIYGEAGLGYYKASATLDLFVTEVTLDVDPTLGYCAAVGALYQGPHFYFGPEIGYQIAPFDKGTTSISGFKDTAKVEGIGTLTAASLMLKMGYKF
ncbi:MAG TPA: outer membrane beta-barrel protein [bacterium]|nr:outer membrane beta-barrel protein [bacterium]